MTSKIIVTNNVTGTSYSREIENWHTLKKAQRAQRISSLIGHALRNDAEYFDELTVEILTK